MSILIFIIIVLSPLIYYLIIWRNDYEIEQVFFAFGISVLIALFFFIPYFGLFGGLVENYSQGERQGYLVKYSEVGVIFKTKEGEMQLGTGNMASLQEPFKFSVYNNDEINMKIQESIGKKVKLKYKQWLLQPFRRGGSDYEITSVELLE